MDKALIVCINKYRLDTIPTLRGCLKDGERLAERLVAKYHFAPSNIRLLYDGRATADAIRQRLEWLRAGNTEDDRIVFAFSGHGVRQTYRDSAGGICGTHEALVAHDFDWDVDDSGTRDIWLAGFFNHPGFFGHRTILLDCCHSGGMDRSLVRRLTRTKRLARGFDAPDDVAWRRVGSPPEVATRAAIVRPNRFTLLAACTATQTAADAYEDGSYCGAFSNALGHILDEGGALSPVSVVRDSVNKLLAKKGYPQDPRALGCELGRPLFGGAR